MPTAFYLLLFTARFARGAESCLLFVAGRLSLAFNLPPSTDYLHFSASSATLREIYFFVCVRLCGSVANYVVETRSHFAFLFFGRVALWLDVYCY